MGKPKAPKPPDYAAAAQEQGEANLNSALATNYLNQPNQVGPDGSLTYSYDYTNGHRLPDGTVVPRTTATTALSPEQQALYNQNNQISQELNQLAIRGIGYVDEASATPVDTSSFANLQYGGGTPQYDVTGGPQGGPLKQSYDFSGVSALPTTEDFTADRDRITDALLARARPELDRVRQQRETALANQGINLGSEAYNRDRNLGDQRENDALYGAILAGSQEQERLFNDSLRLRGQGVGEAIAQGDLFNSAQGTNFAQEQARLASKNQALEAQFQGGLASNQFSNQARAQAFQEADYLKNQPLNLLNALRSGNQVSMPQFGNVATGAQITPAPVYAAANDQYNASLNAYQAKLGARSALLGGLGSIGSAAVGKYG